MPDEPQPPPDPETPPSSARASTTGTVPVTRRVRTAAAFAPGGWARRFAKLWGFLGFCLLVLVLARHVVLPFVFAVLIAYIFLPAVNRLSTRRDGGRRLPKWLAIIFCYLMLLSVIALFLFALLPRLSQDLSRIGAEAPSLEKLNDSWAPKAARWLEDRFPSLASPPAVEPAPPSSSPIPPGTGFVLTPLPDGRWAVQLEPTGLEILPRSGGMLVRPAEVRPEALTLEDKLRDFVSDGLSGLKSELGGLVRLGQRVVSGFIRIVFAFFLVLMVAAFIMLDIQRVHGFVRGLVPAAYRDDYDDIVKGIDRGMSGVIRGQLIICLVNGVFTWVGMVIFGVKYALILATVAAILSLIPIFGSILSSIPIVVVALVSTDSGVDVTKGVAMLSWIIGIHFVEANLLNPKIIGSAARIHPVLVIFALVLGEHSYGLTGALLAVPVASIIQVLFLFFRRKAWREPGAAAKP